MTFQSTPAEDAVRSLNADEEAVVRPLPHLIYALPRSIDADMMREQRMSATEYLTLMRLSEAPNRRLRMGDLSAACEMSLSGTTRVVHRLEKEGFIRRVRCDQDGRGWYGPSPTPASRGWKMPGRRTWRPCVATSSITWPE
ncbi:MarR family transcriptional regulator [Streptomyces sp. NPDC006658]|uniref:MarR family winged helix-turn-helix transcriptional regulator n=1 Tax=Streptomyces sp. NPDC006658 TaxID=3156900 RepID=UPI0033F58249